MKALYLFLCLLPLFYQQKIAAQSLAINTDGSTANASALLDIKSTTKGLLIPRMTKTERNSIATPATGLMIFQTGPDSVGFHYYNGSSWSWVSSSSTGTTWKLAGNSGTNPVNDFIGTFDNQPLRFRLNNTWAGELNGTNGSISLGLNANPNSAGLGNIAIGGSSLRNNSSGWFNTAIGGVTLYNNTTGSENTALGYYALSSNINGRENTATGVNALQKSITVSGNTAYGYFSLYELYSGINNTAVGHYSLKTNKYGSNNTAIGDSADVKDSSYNNATAIGAQSTVNCSDCLVLGSVSGINGASSSVNVGIGTNTPLSALHTKNGAVLFEGATGATPISGAGTRMMWVPAKAALRAGTAFFSSWDNSNIGQYSVAMGYGSTASGSYSMAWGNSNLAVGTLSTATGEFTQATGTAATSLGSYTIASGYYSLATGTNTTASGYRSTAMGNTSIASGSGAIAMGDHALAAADLAFAVGYYATASGSASTAIGNSPTASGTASTAIGNIVTASGNNATAIGYLVAASANNSIGLGSYLKSKSYAGFIAGIYNDTANAASSTAINNLNRIFQVGNGTADNARSNAMTILHSGNTGIGVTSPARLLSVATDIAVDENNGNNGTISNSLHFGASSSGEAIASNRSGGNLWGLDFYTNSTNRLSIDNYGNVGIGTTAPTAKLDVNGTTTTNGFQVGNGTVFTKMQSGSVTVGSNATSEMVYSFLFPIPFSGTPKIFAIARNEPSSSFNDAFSVSVSAVTATYVTFNIQRTDANSGWGQQLRVDWFGME